jgi:uncharacterized protein
MSTFLWYPIADKCINGCLYCFEDPDFKSETLVFQSFDRQKMADTMRNLVERGEDGSQVILHGGEILSLSLDDFEFFLKETRKYMDRVSVQTSLGLPLTPEHLRLMKMYNVELGISVDGPPEYNILRGPRSPEFNKKFQNTVYDNIRLLNSSRIRFGLITILSKANATKDKIDTLIKWCLNNTNGGRFNPLFLPHHREKSEISKYVLSNEELTYAYSRLLDAAIKYPNFDFRLFEEIKSALIGDFRSGCIFNRCDYLTTTCQTILPDGGVARCDRCFQDGYFYTSNKPTNARWQMLEQTECKGCRYFVSCTGGCPSEGYNGDFRSKTMYCESDYYMFSWIENILRKMFPGIVLAIDVHNYYEDFFVPRRRINFLMRDGYFVDTKERMVNNTKLLGWTPDNERPEQIQETKHGYSHMDTNVSENKNKKIKKTVCTCGDPNCPNR